MSDKIGMMWSDHTWLVSPPFTVVSLIISSLMVTIFSPSCRLVCYKANSDSRVTNHPNRWGNLSCFSESHVSRNATFLSECNGTRLGSYLDVGYALSRWDDVVV